MPCMATALMERMSRLEGEAAKEEEERVKDAIASAYAGESLLCSVSLSRSSRRSYPLLGQVGLIP